MTRQKSSQKQTIMCVRLPASTLKHLKKIAKQKDLTVSQITRSGLIMVLAAIAAEDAQ
jgi:hypothetical protein